jgi:hypothetical protein
MAESPIIHLQIHAATLEDLKEFTDETEPDLGCRATARKREGGYVVDAYLPEALLEAARGARSAGKVSIRVIENATEVGRERQQEIGEGNRFAARGEIPRGLGRKE